MSVRVLPSNSTPPANQSGAGPDLGVNKGAGLKDVITLSRVELRVIGVRHDAAVLTIVHLGR